MIALCLRSYAGLCRSFARKSKHGGRLSSSWTFPVRAPVEMASDETPARQTFHFDQNILFSSDFDSGNLGNVEKEGVANPPGLAGSFNVWTLRDNESGERAGRCDSWFYFSVRGVEAEARIRINLMKFKQKNLFNQGWVPVFRTNQGQFKAFTRLRDKPKLHMDTEHGFQVLTFEFKVMSSSQTTWFAFAYPHSYERCQRKLAELERLYVMDAEFRPSEGNGPAPKATLQTIQKDMPGRLYFHREPVIMSRCGRRVDLLTISSTVGMMDEEELRLPGLFPDASVPRANRFQGKKVVFISARVHPGETPASHVFNGFLEFILRADDLRAAKLRDLFVFKLIPILNPDGVGRGHFRVDTRGVNLNRTYMLPNIECHPSIYAARQVMLYHHCAASHLDACPLGRLGRERVCQAFREFDTRVSAGQLAHDDRGQDVHVPSDHIEHPCLPKCTCEYQEPIQRPDGLVLYVDLHAHSNRQGCFIFGNHFADAKKQMYSELFPKLCSLNSPYFDFAQCTFTEKSMRTKEGSGRVAMHRATHLVHCYTLECHYATGKCSNKVAKLPGNCGRLSPSFLSTYSPLYDVKHFEQVGRALGVALLDLTGANPWTRLGQQSPAVPFPKLKSNMTAAIQGKRAELAKRLGRMVVPGFESEESDSDLGDGGGEGGYYRRKSDALEPAFRSSQATSIGLAKWQAPALAKHPCAAPRSLRRVNTTAARQLSWDRPPQSSLISKRPHLRPSMQPVQSEVTLQQNRYVPVADLEGRGVRGFRLGAPIPQQTARSTARIVQQPSSRAGLRWSRNHHQLGHLALAENREQPPMYNLIEGASVLSAKPGAPVENVAGSSTPQLHSVATRKVSSNVSRVLAHRGQQVPNRHGASESADVNAVCTVPLALSSRGALARSTTNIKLHLFPSADACVPFRPLSAPKKFLGRK